MKLPISMPFLDVWLPEVGELGVLLGDHKSTRLIEWHGQSAS